MGDRVVLYMPLVPEGIVAMLACARIGAIHSVVYAGMGTQALKTRIEDAGAKVVVCSDFTYRRGKAVPLKTTVDEAVRKTGANASVIFVPPPFAGDAIMEAAAADLDVTRCQSLKAFIRDKEQEYLRQVLQHTDGDKEQAAKALRSTALVGKNQRTFETACGEQRQQ